MYSGKEDGFRENIYRNTTDSNGKTENLLRSKTRWIPSSRFKFDLTAIYSNQNNKYDVWSPDNDKKFITINIRYIITVPIK